MFLVLYTCTHDDFPIRLCDTYDEAKRVAETLPSRVPPFAEDLFGIGASPAICVKVVEFSNGFAANVTVVRDLESETSVEATS
jgi:hypothetical protein